MKNLTITFFFSIWTLLSVSGVAQSTQNVAEVPPATSESTILPSFGDNFGFTHYEDAVISFNYYTVESDISTLFFHKGFGDHFGLSVGLANSDVVIPEVIYFTPSYGFNPVENIHVGIELRSGYFTEVEDFYVNPQFRISLGTREKHFSLGYGIVSDFDGVENFFGIDNLYLDSAIKFGGRYPITKNVSFVSRNQFFRQSIGNFFNVNVISTRTGIDLTFDRVSVQFNLFLIRASGEGESETETNAAMGASYRF